MKKQIVWLDAVRLLAFFFLLCCHAADPFYATATYANADAGGSVDPLMLMWGERWMAFVRPCVPLFVMITGALMFPVRMPMGAFYKKRILRVLWPFLIWSVLYYLFPWFTGLLGLDKSIVYKCFIWAESDSQSFASSLANILRIPYTFSFIAQHMWYIYMLIGLYLYLPVFSAWVERATKKQMQVFLGLWMLSTLYSTSLQLFETIKTRHYIFTGGNQKERPSEATIAKILTSGLDGNEQLHYLHFNHKNPITERYVNAPIKIKTALNFEADYNQIDAFKI